MLIKVFENLEWHLQACLKETVHTGSKKAM